MVKKALILAGGKGTRLASIAKDIPKPMVTLAGKPILEHQINWCARQGIEEVTLITNHLHGVIEDYFGHGENHGITINYYIEPKPLGTVGGVADLSDQIESTTLILYGDVVFDISLNRLLAFHKDHKSEATLVVHPNDHPYDSDLVETDQEGRITKVFPKPHNDLERYKNLVNAALYVFEPVVFKHLKKGEKADFGKDIFPELYKKVRMFGYSTPEYLKDMGTPDRWAKVSSDLESGKVAARNLEKVQKAIFLDRDGVLNWDTDLIDRPEDFTLYPYTSKTLQRINKSDFLSVIITNQSVIARNLTNLEGLAEIHKKMETDLGAEGAFVDDIYFCPHHPDGGFPGENKAFKKVCECRKPKPGMILWASQKYNIDCSQSYMIGDSERDILAGRAAGATTLAVRTGKGFEGATTRPDYFFANFEEAGNFILDDPYKEAVEEITSQVEKRPGFSIFIGGNARSGKTIVTSRLEIELKNKGLSVLRISLDDWILSKEQRKTENSVLENFQSELLVSDLKKIMDGEKVQAPGYSVHHSFPLQPVSYQYTGQNVVLVEGVIALSVKEWRDRADIKIFKVLDEEKRKARFEEFYQWKGLEKDQIKALYQSRLEMEYDFIDKDDIFADILIK